MGKIVSSVLKVAAIAVNFIPGIGQLASLAITAGLSLASAALAPKAPKVSQAQRERLYATIDPSTPRKIVFGQTAMATDIRYEEWSGTNQEYLDRIVVVASHKVQAIEEIWFDDKLAWTSAGGVQSPYSGYLTVQTRLEGSAANTIAINGGSKWGSSRRLTGCAYVHFRYKTTGNSKKAESPFSSSIPQRMTIKGKGALLYDPRLDSTVGGSGSQRADDQSTWAWTSDTAGNNPALQMLWYLLGWRINGKLAVGRGIPKSRILMSAFIAAANLCEEAVTLAAGGTEPRYRSAGVVSEADAPSAVIDAIEASCAGTLRDASGRLALDILHNDLATALSPGLTDADVIGQCEWQGTKGLDESFNVVRGRYTDPSNNSLYQLVDYPAVSLASPDGLERIHVFDLSMVQSASQAQRLAKQELQRAQYQGVFKGEFKATAWRCQVGSIVPFTFSALGFSNKLFRVVEQVVRMNGTCALVLREENAAIYAWSSEETAPVQPAAPTPYDPINSPLVQAVAETDAAIVAAIANTLTLIEAAQALVAGKSQIFYQPTPPTAEESNANDRWVDTANGNVEYRRIAGSGSVTLGGRAIVIGGKPLSLCWTLADDQRIAQAIKDAAGAQATADRKIVTFNQETTPTAEGIGDLWYKPSTQIVYRWNGLTWADHSSLGAPNGTLVGSSTAADVSGATVNFNGRNDRNGAAIAAATIVGDGSAIDHVINTDGSADISFQWSWGGSEADIDGWLVYVRSSASSSAYTFGSAPAEELVFPTSPEKRAFFVPGVPANRYYTFGVRAFRVVDPDVAPNGRILGPLVQSAASGENPYRPSASVAFAGDITGTVDGLPAASVADGAAAANLGLNSDGTVKSGKVVAGSLAADVLNEVVSATATNVTATDGGVVLLTLSGVSVKPSQGGFVHLILTCNLKLATPLGKTSAILYGRLQRSPAGAGTWTEIHSWLMGSRNVGEYVYDIGPPEVMDFVSGETLRVSAASQYIDVPASNGDYDYRWLASKTPDGTGSTAPEVAAGVADNAYGLALSVKVAA